MTSPPHLQEVFDLLRNGHHLSPEDGPVFFAVAADYDVYATYFAPLGMKLERHQREFFYFAPKVTDSLPEGLTLPRIAVFSFILIDHAANTGQSIDDLLFTTHFFVSRLPHFDLDRYAALLQQVGIGDSGGLRQILRRMETFGWVRFLSNEEFRFLRPFHRMLDKCIELSSLAAGSNDTPISQEPQP